MQNELPKPESVIIRFIRPKESSIQPAQTKKTGKKLSATVLLMQLCDVETGEKLVYSYDKW
jgi:hypothetical protein